MGLRRSRARSSRGGRSRWRRWSGRSLILRATRGVIRDRRVVDPRAAIGGVVGGSRPRGVGVLRIGGVDVRHLAAVRRHVGEVLGDDRLVVRRHRIRRRRPEDQVGGIRTHHRAAVIAQVRACAGLAGGRLGGSPRLADLRPGRAGQRHRGAVSEDGARDAVRERRERVGGVNGGRNQQHRSERCERGDTADGSPRELQVVAIHRCVRELPVPPTVEWWSCRWRCQAAPGRRRVNLVPSPGVLSTEIVPFIASVSSLTIARPRPVPTARFSA